MGSSKQATISIDQATLPCGQRENEDAVLVVEELLGIFDSVGGRDQGRWIAHLASITVAVSWQSLLAGERGETPEQRAAMLATLLQEADTAIATLDILPEHKRPATVAALCSYKLTQEQVWLSIAHLGDSRIYLLRQGQVSATRDERSWLFFLCRATGAAHKGRGDKD